MGSHLEEITDVQFNTGQCWLYIPTVDCADCLFQYDYTQSSYYSEVADGVIDDLYFTGLKAIDQVCIDQTNCGSDLTFINVQSNAFVSTNGILGLCADPTNSLIAGAPSYIDFLYESDIISQRLFCTSLKDESEESSIDFGFIDESAMADSSDLVYIQVADVNQYGQMWWHNVLSGLRFRDLSFETYEIQIENAKSYNIGTP